MNKRRYTADEDALILQQEYGKTAILAKQLGVSVCAIYSRKNKLINPPDTRRIGK